MSERHQHLVFEPNIQAALTQYIVDLFVHETPQQASITANTAAQGLPQIDLRPIEGAILKFFVQMIGAKTAVEIGTLAGYSATWLAQGLGEGGKLITLEVNERHAEIARQNLQNAGLADRVEIRVGKALDTLNSLDGLFDLVFIDANKEAYQAYLTWALSHVRKGGLIIAHNAFRHGNILQEHPDEATSFIKAFNAQIATHEKLLSTIIPVGDGFVLGLVQ